jgi:hypothetical protein
VASRYELRDGRGDYVGTFVTDDECWQVGDVFRTGDGLALRIIGTTTPEQSRERPAFTAGWSVEAVEG